MLLRCECVIHNRQIEHSREVLKKRISYDFTTERVATETQNRNQETSVSFHTLKLQIQWAEHRGERKRSVVTALTENDTFSGDGSEASLDF